MRSGARQSRVNRWAEAGIGQASIAAISARQIAPRQSDCVDFPTRNAPANLAGLFEHVKSTLAGARHVANASVFLIKTVVQAVQGFGWRRNRMSKRKPRRSRLEVLPKNVSPDILRQMWCRIGFRQAPRTAALTPVCAIADERISRRIFGYNRVVSPNVGQPFMALNASVA